MSTVDVLLDLFRGDAGTDDPSGYLEEQGAEPRGIPRLDARGVRPAARRSRPRCCGRHAGSSPDRYDSTRRWPTRSPVPEDASTAELMEHYATVINISHSIEEAGDTIYGRSTRTSRPTAT